MVDPDGKLTIIHGTYAKDEQWQYIGDLNSIVVTSDTLSLNKLTPSIVSKEGESACYREVKVSIEKV